MNSYTLGLDIGSNSIGWALIDTRRPSIAAIGVRVFPEGVDRDNSGREISRNAERRQARSARRQNKRRSERKRKLINCLRKANLLPCDDHELKEILQLEPYELRAKGLDEKLQLYELGRVLVHINQRRGFKSNRKAKRDKQISDILKSASELQQKIDESGCRTIGEYFAKLDPEQERIRGHYTFRQMYEREFDLLWERQSQFYPDILTDELRSEIRDKIIFYQRPLKPQEDLIGNCSLETNEKRCPRADWYAIKFRILQDINHLLIYNPDGSEQPLTDQQRQLLLEMLTIKNKVTFDQIRKKLGLLETQRFNYEQGGQRHIKGDEFNCWMRNKKVFGPKRWDEMDQAEKEEINQWLIKLEKGKLEEDEIVERLKTRCGFTDEQVDAFFDVDLPDGYMSFSRLAIEKLLPFMQNGYIIIKAIQEVYPDKEKSVIEVKDRLDSGTIPDLRNPIVNRAIREMRKLVNAIISEFGKPTKIKIEMARDVKGTRRERQEILFRNKENEKENQKIRNILIEQFSISSPSRTDILKYKLWQECGGVCPYTGKPIPLESLFGDNPEFQIEHIIPYDRSLDDSFMNKTLCDVYENAQVKKNQTPFEAYSHDQVRYQQILQRVNSSNMPRAKKKKFSQKKVDLDEHIDRELNDTRYICKETVKYLKQLGVNVQGTRGRVTGQLRHQWGLDTIFDQLGTNRDDDHRRHAVDAVIVAVTENKHLRELAKSKYDCTGREFALPWPGFREELLEKLKLTNVSYRVCKKVSGKLHEETSYGITGLKDEKGQDIFVYRKKLEELTPAMVSKIVDPVVKSIVAERLKSFGFALKGNKQLPKEIWSEPLYMKNTKSTKKVPIKKVRIRDVFNNMIYLNGPDGKPYRAVASGNNHHIEIFEYVDRKGNTKRDGRVITMFEAVQRSQRKIPVVQRDYGDGRRFVCSLAANEMFMLENNDGKTYLCRVQKISQSGKNKTIVLRPHYYGGKLSDSDKEPLIFRRTPNSLKGYKVGIDFLGRLWKAND